MVIIYISIYMIILLFMFICSCSNIVMATFKKSMLLSRGVVGMFTENLRKPWSFTERRQKATESLHCSTISKAVEEKKDSGAA